MAQVESNFLPPKRTHGPYSLFGLSLLLLAAAGPNPSAQAAEIAVFPGYGTLPEAIANASPGDTLLLENADYRGDIIINKSLTLRGPGGGAVLRSASGAAVISGATTAVGMEGIAFADWPGSPPEREIIAHYYINILDRPPDSGGIDYWDGQSTQMRRKSIESKEAFVVMAVYFFTSEEYLARNTSDATFVGHLYRTFFDRESDMNGLAFWLNELSAGTPRDIVLFNFLFSNEFRTFMANYFADSPSRAENLAVVDYYRGLLNRLPDAAGLDYWVGQFRSAQCGPSGEVASQVYTLAQTISEQFLNGDEYLGRGQSNAEYVSALYNAFLRRGGDREGVQHWIDQLDGQLQTRDQLRRSFIESAEFTTRVEAIVNQGCLP